jgi:hypothetical protein
MPTDQPAHRRRFLQPAALLGAAALVLSLLVPGSAPARGAHDTQPVTHGVIAHRQCALKGRKRPSKPRRAARGCAKGRSLARGRPNAKRPHGVPGGRAGAAGTPPSSALGASPSPEPTGPTAELTDPSGEPTGPAEGSAPAPPAEGPATGEPGGELPPGESSAGPWPTGGVLTDPIDPRFLTTLPFGASSFWIQPWRAYLDTWPASQLLDAVGVNFNVRPAGAEDAAQLLRDSGFKLARIGVAWNAISYDDPTALRPADEASITARLTALHRHGLRPLIILDSNSGDPAPSTAVTLDTTSEAPAGSQSVRLSAASAAEVVPGKTGFDGLTRFKGAPDILIASVGAGDVATLSRPLPGALAAGEHRGTTLLYAPFGPPTLAGGAPNPAFETPLKGWLSYVAAVCREAASVVGPEGYDLEVWNELSFGSQFLNAENYYSPTSEGGSGAGAEAEAEAEGEGDSEAEGGSETEGASQAPSKKEVNHEIVKALLDETVAYVRNPVNGISPGVGIADGFASQTPFPSGAKAPLGLTALSKHPYQGAESFPASYQISSIRPLNALGLRDTSAGEPAPFTPLFTPSYQSLFPEYTLTATSTETVIRDLAPLTTKVYGFPHGRTVGPPGGSPVQKWVTEYNLDSAGVTPVGPDEVSPQTGSSAQLTPADKAHFEAKTLLRSLVAMTGKGVSREYFYAAADAGDLSMIGQSFMAAAEAHPTTYPGDAFGGEVMSGFHNLLAQFQGPGPGPEGARQLTLLSIAQDGNHAQFSGDGTTAHPDLYDRDVLAVLPFQSSPTRFEIPVYVMTRDLLTLYEPGAPASDIHRFDLPGEAFQITLGNLPETSAPPTVSAYDPLRNEATPARLVSRAGASATFELAATDYPRILTIEFS